MNNVAISIHIQVIEWTYVFISLEYIPRSRITGHMAVLCLIIWGTVNLFPKAAAPFHIPTSSVQRFQIRASDFLILDISECVTCFSCGFCITQMTSGVQHLFICSLAICISSWRNVYSDVYSELNRVPEFMGVCHKFNRIRPWIYVSLVTVNVIFLELGSL